MQALPGRPIIGIASMYASSFTGRFSSVLKVDFLSSQKPLAVSQQVFANLQNNFLSSHEYDNLMKIGLAGLSNRGSQIKLLRSLYDLLNVPIFS